MYAHRYSVQPITPEVGVRGEVGERGLYMKAEFATPGWRREGIAKLPELGGRGR